ncbi:MAG: class I SAM-dependent methyltransferase, partial [Planctomycetota bacterium]
MAAFSIRQFVCEQHCVPWKLRLLVRRLIPWRLRRVLTKGRSNLNCPDAMDTTYASLDDAFTSMDALYDRLVPLLPAEGKVLDAGCGIAVLLRRIASEHPKLKLFGIDFSPVGVQRTREHGFEAELAVLPDVPYPDEYFDGVVCTEVLEHLDDPVAAVRSFHRILTPGGRLVISVPRGMGPDYCDEHVQDFTAETIREC